VEEFVDGLQGHQSRQLQSEVGDFTIRRSDGQIGYQLACAIDETAMGIAEVVRGIDLLGSSFRQRIVQKNLGLEHPSYMHLPLLLDATGRKLSKQNHAPSISATSASDNLWFCLDYLQQGPPAELKGAAPSELLNWAVNHWKIENIPK
jgi:glutamyl-Q tRNA(Asp) synthetase